MSVPGGSYSVRQASTADLAAVVRVLARQVDDEPTPVSTRQVEMWARMMATADLAVYVAEGGGETVGTTSLLVLPNLTYDCRPTAFIEPMVVAAPHRRRGVGRLLVQRALDDARAADCRKVQVVSHKRHAQDGAHAFYRALGFEPEAEGFRMYIDP